MNRARVLRVLSQHAAAASEAAAAAATTTTNEPKGLATNSAPKSSVGTNQQTNQTIRSNVARPPLKTIPESNTIDEHTSEGRAASSSKIDEDDVMEMLDRWDPMAEDFNSADNTLTLDPDKQPECVVTGKMADESIMIGKHRVCEHYLKHKTCADGQYCSRLHVDPSARDRIQSLQREYETSTGKTRMISSHLSPIELEPSEHTLLLVSVTMITSPTRFYFVAPYEKMNFTEFNEEDMDFYIGRVQQSSVIKTKLQRIHEQLSRLFDHNYRVDNLNSVLCIGQMVACKLQDGRFCRATVLDNRDMDDFESYYKLFLIDIGIEVRLTRDAIYEIRASCLSEPPMAVLGRLELKPANGDLHWSREAKNLFENFATKSKYLLCKVKSYLSQDDLFTIDLFSVENRTSITDLMLARNLADRMKIS